MNHAMPDGEKGEWRNGKHEEKSWPNKEKKSSPIEQSS